MANRQVVIAWLQKADEDFGFASSCLADELEYFGHICFHFQQGAEKYLKSFIVVHDLPLRKIHNLLVLLDACCTVDSSLEELREPCRLVNRYYIDTRYPVHWPTKFTKADAEEAQQAVGNIKERIAQLFSKSGSG